MSQSSGNPTRRITEVKGSPPANNLGRRTRQESPEEEAARKIKEIERKRELKASLKTQKQRDRQVKELLRKEKAEASKKVNEAKSKDEPEWATSHPWLKEKPAHWMDLSYWWIYVTFGLYRFLNVPPPRVVFGARNEIAANSEFINKVRHIAMATIAVMMLKGGATKTTIATWLAAFIANANHLATVIFDGDRGKGKVAVRYGLDPDKTLSIVDYTDRIDKGERITYETLIEESQSDEKTGVVVLHAPPALDIGTAKTRMSLRSLKEECATLVCDSGPGFLVDISNAIALNSNVHVIVAKGISEESIGDVKATIWYPDYKLTTISEEGGFVPKENVMVTISGLKANECNKRTQYETAARIGIDPSNVILVPYERYLDDRYMGNLKRVLLSAISTQWKLALSRIARRATELAVNVNKKEEEAAALEVYRPTAEFPKVASHL